MKLPLTSILIGDRQRLEVGDLADLDSMSDPDVGQVQPIKVHKTLQGWELVAGRRRLAKAVELGWKEIEAVESDTLTPLQKQKQELFEDIGRTDRPWQDLCLSIRKIHLMMQADRCENGEKWTITQTSKLFNYGHGGTHVKCMLKVAEVLLTTPRDEEAWSCTSFTEAYDKCIVDRLERVIRGEMDRRREILAQQESLPIIAEESTTEGEESAGHLLTSTEEAPRITKIKIRGFNMAFEDAVPGEHFMEECFYCTISHNPTDDRLPRLLYPTLRPDGFSVIWLDDPYFQELDLTGFQLMPWAMVWNQIKFNQSVWPVCPNYGCGHVLRKPNYLKTSHPNPSSSVISAMPEFDGLLPSAVIEHTLKAFCPPNMAVLLTHNANPVAVAAYGNTPVFFEPDKAKYEAKVEALKKWYEENVPNVEVTL